jgi:hypothetical protein
VLVAHHDFQLLVVHVSGKRMQAKGTDGASGGQLSEGVTNGQSIMSFMPLHLTAFDCSPKMKEWLRIFVSPDLEFLTVEGKDGRRLLG